MSAAGPGVQGAGTPNAGTPSAGTPNTRAHLLGILRGRREAITVADLAERMGVHPNTIRFHLDQLLANGQVERVTAPSTRRGRPAMLVRATAGMDPEGPREYRALAAALTEALAGSPDGPELARRAGLAWGTRLAREQSAARGDEAPDSVPERLRQVMAAVGFDPSPLNDNHNDHDDDHDDDHVDHIDLRHCPFLELATTSPGIVCQLHLGLVQGALDAFGSTQRARGLEPFAEPDACRVHLDVS